MTDDGELAAPPPQVGLLADEAAEFLSALKGWIAEAAGQHATSVGGAASTLSGSLREAGEHVSHGQDCSLCPVCQVISALRAKPEVREQLGLAAASFVQALNGLLASHVSADPSSAARGSRVEKIDLDEAPPDAAWPDE